MIIWRKGLGWWVVCGERKLMKFVVECVKCGVDGLE